MGTPSLIGVFQELNGAVGAGVLATYAVGGAVGASFFVEPTFTEDVDVFVTFSAPAGLVLVPKEFEYFVQRGAVFQGEHLWMHGWKVQLLPAETPLLREAVERSLRFEEDGEEFRVMAPEYLTALALQLGRPKDQVRLQEFASSKTVDHELFATIVQQHGLHERLALFRRQFPEVAL